GDQPERLGLTYEALRHVNRKVVCCALTGYGTSGERRAEPAYDYLMQAEAGWMSITGEPGAPPAKSGLSVVDFSAGLAAMVGLLGGVIRARETGEGCDLDVSLFDTAISMLNYVAVWTLNREYEPQRMARSAHPSIVPSQVFQTADGWIVVFCAKEKFWRNLGEAMGAQDLLSDPRYQSFAGRMEHREEFVTALKERFSSRTTGEWLALLRGKVPCAPVNDPREALESQLALERNMILAVDHPEFGTVRQTNTPIKVTDGIGVHPDSPGPAIGADTDALLRDILGYTADEIRELRRAGAIS
ncbi:MAG: CaiB/BaiF CoA transferase family protein, partial [Chloroflexota bacterium]